MKTSPFQTILYVVFGLAALIGIFVFATQSSKTSNQNNIGTVVIWGTLPKDALQNTITAVGQSSTKLKTVSYVQKDVATLVTDLTSAIATGNAPDLILASQEQLRSLTPFVSPIPLSTLSANFFANSFIQEGNLFTAPAGAGYYGIPFLVDPLVLYSNRSILSSNGVAQPPATWEALTGLVPHIAVLTSNQQIKRGLIALGTYPNVTNARGILSALFLQQNVPLSGYTAGGSLGADLGINSTNNTPVGPAVTNFYTQFADPSKVSYTWNASLVPAQQSFLSGDLALYLGYASEARYFANANPNLNFLVTPFPQPATASAKSTYGLVYAFMIPHGANNVSGALAAAGILTTADPNAQSIAVANTGLAPAVLSELAKAQSDPVLATAYAEALYARGWLSPAPIDTDRVFSSMITDVVTGRSNVNTALATAQSALSALLQK